MVTINFGHSYAAYILELLTDDNSRHNFVMHDQLR